MLGISCIVFQLTDLVAPLRFDRPAIESGQLWRVFTGNLVHLGYSHLILNLAGLFVIVLLVGHALNAWQWLLVTSVCMLGVGLGLFALDPQLVWYVGMSGALYGMLIAGSIADLRHNFWIALILIVYTIGKTLSEQLYGAASSSEVLAGGKVIVNAHLYGMLTGIACALLLIACRQIPLPVLPSRGGKRADRTN